ncbi:hypothetical protein [Sorangium atrum]|uniref:Uncharacterized protein n=1 Tax=Sorangium atrum TaxID=2995308 RepID=A0ABT5CCV5_9BACT|nr:hypothetical protein [Sorangium aterium]MDC0682956.1 hypothetical protein [Sorangium aterium]
MHPDAVGARARVSADVERHVAWLREDAELGFSAIRIRNVTLNQQFFLEVLRGRVPPALCR